MVPQLPTALIRDAIADDRLDEASELIGEHARQVQLAITDGRLDASRREAWQELLDQQRLLLTELQRARDESSEALKRMRGQRRGSDAYRRAAGGAG